MCSGALPAPRAVLAKALGDTFNAMDATEIEILLRYLI
jgi:hypothetical protein